MYRIRNSSERSRLACNDIVTSTKCLLKTRKGFTSAVKVWRASSPSFKNTFLWGDGQPSFCVAGTRPHTSRLSTTGVAHTIVAVAARTTRILVKYIVTEGGG